MKVLTFRWAREAQGTCSINRQQNTKPSYHNCWILWGIEEKLPQNLRFEHKPTQQKFENKKWNAKMLHRCKIIDLIKIFCCESTRHDFRARLINKPNKICHLYKEVSRIPMKISLFLFQWSLINHPNRLKFYWLVERSRLLFQDLSFKQTPWNFYVEVI